MSNITTGEATMSAIIPAWIIGGPFIGLLILSFSFKGASAMGGTGLRMPPRGQMPDSSADLLDPMHPGAPRRLV
jgi:hypothetical protein